MLQITTSGNIGCNQNVSISSVRKKYSCGCIGDYKMKYAGEKTAS
jgi:hypothetical protein